MTSFPWEGVGWGLWGGGGRWEEDAEVQQPCPEGLTSTCRAWGLSLTAVSFVLPGTSSGGHRQGAAG